MKTAFVLTFSALLVGHGATAQQLRFGAKAGVNYADLNIRHVGGFKRLLGLNAGVVGRYALSSDGFWNLQAELLYSGKGQRSGGIMRPVGAPAELYHDRIHCLDLPVLAKINARGLTVEAGPQLSYVLKASSETDGGRIDTRDRLRPVQLGYAVGVGYELPAGYSLTVRYAADVTSIYKSGPFFDSVHSTAFQAQLGYLLGKAE
ncbi:PorT family protein [Hymenobacter sp. 15J16-1T3B]|uniref:porin family protein n=1 Tax=Hymenobacter sp. 15J16-1T3B TaxID=2886941 RepID=UPI001D12C8BF|nr:porin family protein [Hymenobacter sp. 15J16-1T3B]MCC3158636.1 PorT family protein [Hymenobacter sp. 15J16-1T3B]